jgi:1,2-phenylacetyl-CoA epoxidase catalytic subunit
MDYSERYCAFVDILGFSELVKGLAEASMPFTLVRDLLKVVHAPAHNELVILLRTSDLKAQSISDAVCLSTAPSEAGLGQLYYSLMELTLNLLDQGFFVRGAIVR